MKATYWTPAAGTLLIFSALGLGCDDDPEKKCTPKETQVCTCPDGSETGVQTCTTDGSGWGLCNCAGAPSCGDDVADFASCLDCYCEDALDICYDNDACVDLLGCVNECDDSACDADCSAEYPDGVTDLVEVLNCRDSNCDEYMTDPGDCTDTVDDFDTCLDCYCTAEMNSCLNDDDCYGLATCIDGCESTACMDGCAADFEAGIDAYNAVIDCRDNNCSDYLGGPAECEDTVADFDTCFDCYCTDELEGCFNDEDCYGLVSCLGGCEDDMDCIDGCATDFEAGIDAYFAVIDCRDDNCVEYMNDPSECAPNITDFDTCLDCYCGGYVSVCNGNDDCIDLLYCISECDAADDACFETCASTYSDGIEDLINVLDCRDVNCSDYMG